MQFYSVPSAAIVADCHPQTVSDALRAGALHGVQRGKGGHWKVEDSCLRAWILGEKCAHKALEDEVAA